MNGEIISRLLPHHLPPAFGLIYKSNYKTMNIVYTLTIKVKDDHLISPSDISLYDSMLIQAVLTPT